MLGLYFYINDYLKTMYIYGDYYLLIGSWLFFVNCFMYVLSTVQDT